MSEPVPSKPDNRHFRDCPLTEHVAERAQIDANDPLWT
jgi:hypothetical protein